ncbi:MAG TPA: hypothetical protein VGO18_21970, partial [Steroidobacteraceae bacterium]|nr:hypothetical protein [Steroidobacteraceae bacterium]
ISSVTLTSAFMATSWTCWVLLDRTFPALRKGTSTSARAALEAAAIRDNRLRMHRDPLAEAAAAEAAL